MGLISKKSERSNLAATSASITTLILKNIIAKSQAHTSSITLVCKMKLLI